MILNHKALILVIFAALSLSLIIPCCPAKAEDYGLKDTVTAANDPFVKGTPQDIAGTVIASILSFIGVIFFLLIFYGGFRWMIAQGNDQEVEKAKQILVAATIGLIIVLSAYAITYYIGSRLTGTPEEIPPATSTP